MQATYLGPVHLPCYSENMVHIFKMPWVFWESHAKVENDSVFRKYGAYFENVIAKVENTIQNTNDIFTFTFTNRQLELV